MPIPGNPLSGGVERRVTDGSDLELAGELSPPCGQVLSLWFLPWPL